MMTVQTTTNHHRSRSQSEAISPGFFATLGTKIVLGRDFDEREPDR
jgi:hypothetical protein